MTKTKLLLTGLLAGAVAFGTACKTDKGATGTDTSTGANTTTMGTDAGTGGAGYDNPDRGGVNPLPDEGTREREPGVHEGDIHAPAGNAPAGNPGLEPGPLGEERDLSNETGEEPNNPGSQSPQPINDDPTSGDNGASQPRQ
jgi:hypothetical protein